MDIVEGIMKAVAAIRDQCENMTYCKKQKNRLMKRMECLLKSIKRIHKAWHAKKYSSDLIWMLQETLNLLKEAQEMLRKYVELNQVYKFVKANSMLKEFASLNERFSDICLHLLLQLQVEEKLSVDQEDLQDLRKPLVRREGSQDLAEDSVSLKEMSKEESLVAGMGLTEIYKSQLTNVILLMECESYKLCRGKYNNFSVAIKVFKNPFCDNKPQNVRHIFEKEVKTMKRFESPYIVRLFGMCIDESVPEYSIVTEYCEKGTLKEVLKSEPHLPWEIRLDMASDAAAGLYRLHQTGDKPQVHYCINSTKFLVAKGYCVKLSGFELSQTVSSIQRKPKEKPHKEVFASAYICPEGLLSVDHQYNLASEIYSFGIVLWEIATGKIPFAGCTSKEIRDRVCNKEQEPLGDDCPSYLRDVINQCRDFNPSRRPTAEAIVNQLLLPSLSEQ
ncbi:mixed lineage kinase domain-like protein [Rhineura floridana]|uniref:mixed lineage kinase domain-like protein n=1 Tax=Rhineura floridana TaxID=261503 RepID=UPI002AC87EBD|nr:mixed lineage kinase domain-like protein [Rhineura floridana]